MKLEIIVLREISQICICQKDKYMLFSPRPQSSKACGRCRSLGEEGGMRGRKRMAEGQLKSKQMACLYENVMVKPGLLHNEFCLKRKRH